MKRTLQIIGAVAAGYVVLAALVILGVMAAAWLMVPAGESAPGSDYLVANIVLSFLASAIGGYAAAVIGKADGKLAALALAILVMALGLILESGHGQPGWYAASIPWIGAAGVIAGGVARILFKQNRPT